MRFLTVIPLVASLASSSSLPSAQYIFSNPSSDDTTSGFRIPTVHESAVQARRILTLENIGTLSTVFPSDHDSLSSSENRPKGLGGAPIGLMDYFADCSPADDGNPTILAIQIATSFKNVAAGSNITLSLRWHPQHGHPPSHSFHSAAALPRYSLIGHLEELSVDEVRRGNVAACFVKAHPDAVAWLPGNPIHESRWVKLVVQEVYWIGGFGDRAYIGWIPVETWRSVTREEIEGCRLPGEKKGWDDWFMGAFGWEL